MVKQQTNKKDLLIELVRTSFKDRYNDSVLGFLWVLLKPLMTFIILFVVFSSFRNQDIINYPIYLLLGVIMYSFFTESMTLGMNSLLEKAHIILKVNFPREIAIISSQLMALINFAINLLILAFFIFLNPISTTPEAFLYFLGVLVILVMLVYSVSLFSSIISVYLKDLANIFEVLLQLGFYATPIFYPLDIIPERFRVFIELNPLTILIQAARKALMYGEITNERSLLIMFSVVVIAIIGGNIFFKRQVKRVAEFF